MSRSISRLAAARKRMSSSFPRWVVLPPLCWLIGPLVTWHNSLNLPEHDVSACMLSFGASECLRGFSASNRLCAGLSEHQRLCKREHVNVKRWGMWVEVTWWEPSLPKRRAITAASAVARGSPLLPSLQILGLWSSFLARSTSFPWNSLSSEMVILLYLQTGII